MIEKITNSKEEYYTIIDEMQKKHYTNTGVQFLDYTTHEPSKKVTECRKLSFEILPEPKKPEPTIEESQKSLKEEMELIKDYLEATNQGEESKRKKLWRMIKRK